MGCGLNYVSIVWGMGRGGVCGESMVKRGSSCQLTGTVLVDHTRVGARWDIWTNIAEVMGGVGTDAGFLVG